MKKVNVLLSAYNGEAYIEEQINSILNQTYKQIELYVRNDGSSDRTSEILRQYEEMKNVHIIEGKNVGFIESFFELVRVCEDADYYAYSDQDDVWLPDKIEMAIQFIEMSNIDENIPVLYFSNYDYYDENMRFQAHGCVPKIQPSFHNAIVDCITLGFNSVFNNATRKTICEHMPEHSCGHDWWTYMVCAGLGQVVYDNRVTVRYRRHRSNVSAGGMSFLKFQIWRFKKFFLNDYFDKIRLQMKEYESFYSNELSEEDSELLNLFCEDKYRFRNVIRKVFYRKRYRGNFLDEIFVRFIMLIGRL